MTRRFLFLFAIIALPMFAFGQKVEFTKPYKYTASNDDSRNSAKAKAMEEAQAALLQELGVLVEARQKMTTSVSGNNKQEDFVEELKTYTIGKVQTIVVAGTERFTDNDKGDMVYSATFKMAVDTSDLYKYLDNIVRQKEQARADSLAIIKKRMEEEAEAARRQRAQIEKVRADSIAKVEKVRDLEIAVKTAKDLFSQEEAQIRPLIIEKEKKEKELNEADEQRKNAQKAFDNVKNASDAHTEIGTDRINNEAKILQKAKDNYDKKLSEYNMTNKDLNEADKRIQAAKNNLRTAEENLAKEINTQSVSAQADSFSARQALPKTDIAFNELEARKNVDAVSRSEAYRIERQMYEKQVMDRSEANRIERQMNEKQVSNTKRGTPAPDKTKSGRCGNFVFSLRPEFVMESSVMGAGMSVELGGIGKKGFCLTSELDGGSIYGGGLNIGWCFNKDGNVKNVLGISGGYHNTLHFVDFTKDNIVEQSAIGTNTGIAGVFWKLMFGKNKNFDITNKFLVGLRKNPVDYDWGGGCFIYEEGINFTYICGIGYTLTKGKK